MHNPDRSADSQICAETHFAERGMVRLVRRSLGPAVRHVDSLRGQALAGVKPALHAFRPNELWRLPPRGRLPELAWRWRPHRPCHPVRTGLAADGEPDFRRRWGGRRLELVEEALHVLGKVVKEGGRGRRLGRCRGRRWRLRRRCRLKPHARIIPASYRWHEARRLPARGRCPELTRWRCRHGPRHSVCAGCAADRCPASWRWRRSGRRWLFFHHRRSRGRTALVLLRKAIGAATRHEDCCSRAVENVRVERRQIQCGHTCRAAAARGGRHPGAARVEGADGA